jgi:tetratricopeptide (TPR) repeat protein
MTGDVIGTVRYMSPEQALGKPGLIDHRTDLYSLGVTLYEVLTLQPACAGTDRHEVLRQIEREEPRPPRRLNPNIPADLETIVLKAIAKSPADRYATAQEMADDLRRFLECKPIRARRPTLREVAGKWARRHKTAVGTAAGFLALGLIGLAVATVLIGVAYRAEAQQHQRAEENLTLALQAMDDIVMPLVARRLPRISSLGPDERQLIEKARQFYETFLQKNGDRLELRQEIATAYCRVAQIQERLGERQKAEDTFREALRRFQTLATEFPQVPVYRQRLAQIWNNLGILLKVGSRLQEGEQALRQALELQQQLVLDFPTEGSYQHELAMSHNNLGNLLSVTGRLPEAEEVFQQALASQERLVAVFPAAAVYRHELATSHIHRGNLFYTTGRLREAEQAYRQALALQQKLVADVPTEAIYHQHLAQTHHNLGVLLAATGQSREAEQTQRQALTFQERLATNFPGLAEFRHDLAMSHRNLGELQATLGRHREAEQAFRQALTLSEALAADFPGVTQYQRHVAGCQFALGTLLAETRRFREAEQAHRRALELRQHLAADFPAVADCRLELATSHINLGTLLQTTGRRPEAEQAYGQALELLEPLTRQFPTVIEYQRRLAACRYNLGHLLQATHRHREAEQAYRRALAVQQRLTVDFPLVVNYRCALVATHNQLGNVLQTTGRLQEAIQVHRRAVELLQRLAHDFPNRPAYRMQLAEARSNLATGLFDFGQAGEAAQVIRAALEVLTQLVADFPDVPDYQSHLGVVLYNCARMVYNQGDLKGARPLLERAFRAQQQALKADPTNSVFRDRLCQHHFLLAGTLMRLGEHEAMAQIVLELPRIMADDWQGHFEAAQMMIPCVQLVRKDPRLSDVQRANQIQAYTDQIKDLLRNASQRGENNPTALNALARYLATCPDPRFRDASQAVDLARKVATKTPNDGAIWNTLGVALYRAGDWQSAVTALEKGMSLRQGEGSGDWFFLAMAHWRLGNKEQARQWHERALRWMAEHRPKDIELGRARAEAARLLHSSDPPAAGERR